MLVVLFHQEAQPLAQFLGAPEQRDDLLGRILQQLQVRADQVERGQQVGIDLFVVLAERVAARERDAPVGLAEQAEELRRRVRPAAAGCGPVPACRTSSSG